MAEHARKSSLACRLLSAVMRAFSLPDAAVFPPRSLAVRFGARAIFARHLFRRAHAAASAIGCAHQCIRRRRLPKRRPGNAQGARHVRSTRPTRLLERYRVKSAADQKAPPSRCVRSVIPKKLTMKSERETRQSTIAAGTATPAIHRDIGARARLHSRQAFWVGHDNALIRRAVTLEKLRRPLLSNEPVRITSAGATTPLLSTTPGPISRRTLCPAQQVRQSIGSDDGREDVVTRPCGPPARGPGTPVFPKSLPPRRLPISGSLVRTICARLSPSRTEGRRRLARPRASSDAASVGRMLHTRQGAAVADTARRSRRPAVVPSFSRGDSLAQIVAHHEPLIATCEAAADFGEQLAFPVHRAGGPHDASSTSSCRHHSDRLADLLRGQSVLSDNGPRRCRQQWRRRRPHS